ncbi:unnamed protein product [Dibothriocephalus latus]|uniref:Bicarbonate transporter-like transmembrane domain-containing protein n=1 Tax=Dibothriocephalus latus TaxID=60516 RepID=A0A3P7M4B4_DIBLA|nr:unnamed protein product [Dibothriocephalus latus]
MSLWGTAFALLAALSIGLIYRQAVGLAPDRFSILKPAVSAAYPPSHYLRRVPQRRIHLFTALQLLQLGILCSCGFTEIPFVKIGFPILLFLQLLVRLALSYVLTNCCPKIITSFTIPVFPRSNADQIGVYLIICFQVGQDVKLVRPRCQNRD